MYNIIYKYIDAGICDSLHLQTADHHVFIMLLLGQLVSGLARLRNYSYVIHHCITTTRHGGVPYNGHFIISNTG